MENERRKALEDTMKRFNKNQKSQVFKFGDTIEDFKILPTGIEKFDDFMGGGFKKGAHTIIWGAFSVGKTALLLHTIANAQKKELICCYVNLEKPIDRERFEFFGVDLKNLIRIDAPNNAEQALEALRTLCKEKVVDIFIIDSINGLCPKSMIENKGGKERALEDRNIASLAKTLSEAYQKINADVFRSGAGVVWIGQMRTGGIGSFYTHAELTGGSAQKFYAYQIVFMRKGQSANAPIKKEKEFYTDPDGKERFRTNKVPCGFECVFKMEKTNSCKSVKENITMSLPFYYESGFNDPVKEIDLNKEIKRKELEEKLDGIVENVLPDDQIIDVNTYAKDKKQLEKSIETSTSVEGVKINPEKPKAEDVKWPEDTVRIPEAGIKPLKKKRTVRAKSDSKTTKEAMKSVKKNGRGRPRKT